ncbi:MAG TPA: transposase [Casimicrobiaceae bacterium]|nr:transposase [Casimicrobiaceae bacterium]
MEVITDGGRRRRWTEQEKAQMVVESFAPGAVVAEVARRHDARAQQLHTWRRDAREGRLVLPPEFDAPQVMSFAPLVVTPALAARAARRTRSAAPMIEIEAKDIVVRVRDGADVLLVEAMVRALRVRA